jgi:hypothetical protein
MESGPQTAEARALIFPLPGRGLLIRASGLVANAVSNLQAQNRIN